MKRDYFNPVTEAAKAAAVQTWRGAPVWKVYQIARKFRRILRAPDGRRNPARGKFRRTNIRPLPRETSAARLIGTAEAARRLGCSPDYIRTLVQREDIPYYKPRGRLLFDPKELESWQKLRRSAKETKGVKFPGNRTKLIEL